MIRTLTFQDVNTIPLRMVKTGRNMWAEFLMMFCSIVYYIMPCWIRFNNIITKSEISSRSNCPDDVRYKAENIE